MQEGTGVAKHVYKRHVFKTIPENVCMGEHHSRESRANFTMKDGAVVLNSCY